MSESVCILGRQPALGLAELESLFGADNVKTIGQDAALLQVKPPDVPLKRLGGTVKVCKLLTYLPYTDWNRIGQYLTETLPQHVGYLPAEGKVRLGLSVHGLDVSPKRVAATGLELKKAVKTAGRSARVVPNKALTLNTAQVIHNQLVGPTGMELVLIKDKDRTVLAQTGAVQNIEAYAARDQARPKRDPRVGMLPPKLAQIIINLAVDRKTEDRRLKSEKTSDFRILDPFCGTGVVLQEALLMGYNVYGTDLEPRMVEYTKANLDWLNVTSVERRVSQGDATNEQWGEPFDVIAAETYLGRPFPAEPKPDVLREVMRDVDTIHKKFLKNVVRQTKPGFRMCIAVPAWKTRSGFQHLPTLDHLEELGYTRVSFVHARDSDLIYHREGQVVGRELVVLIRR